MDTLRPFAIIFLIALITVSGCISQNNKEPGNQDSYEDTKNTAYFIKSTNNLMNIRVFESTLIKNIISPAFFKEAGKYPLINYELSHVIVPYGKENFLHTLKNTSETIYILSGNGTAEINGVTSNLKSGDALFIPEESCQKLKNTGMSDLTYLSLTSPPFDESNEVFLNESLFEDRTLYPDEKALLIRSADLKKEIFFDDVEIYKILDPEILKENNIDSDMNIGIALSLIPKNSLTSPHILEGTTEVMYFISGKGNLQINRNIMTVKAMDTVYIPPGAHQSLENTGDGSLIYITITDPPYKTSADSAKL